MPLFDTSTEFGARVERRLKTEAVIWLTTVSPSGVPEPRPVWFVWDGVSFLVYSKPGTYKLEHIASNPRVALHFDGDGNGGDIVVFTGTARLDDDAPPASEHSAYAEKYHWGFKRVGTTPETFAADYSVALRIHPESLRGH